MQDKMLYCRTICKIGDSWQVCLLLLAMTTCFMSNQICRVGGVLCFLFDSYALLLCQKLEHSLPFYRALNHLVALHLEALNLVALYLFAMVTNSKLIS